MAVELVAESPPAPPESPRPRCVRVGCERAPIENSEWDSEYCSSECVVRHCRWVRGNGGKMGGYGGGKMGYGGGK